MSNTKLMRIKLFTNILHLKSNLKNVKNIGKYGNNTSRGNGNVRTMVILLLIIKHVMIMTVIVVKLPTYNNDC